MSAFWKAALVLITGTFLLVGSAIVYYAITGSYAAGDYEFVRAEFKKPRTASASGRVIISEDVEVTAPVNGDVRLAPLKTGANVIQGEILMVYAQTQSDAAFSENCEKLIKQGELMSELKRLATGAFPFSISEEMLEAVKAQHDQTLKSISEYGEIQNQRVLRSPVTGTISSISEAGSFSGGETIYTIKPAERYRASLMIDESDILYLGSMSLSAALDALSGESFPARIVSISDKPRYISSRAAYPVTIAFSCPYELYAGMTVTASFTETEPQTLLTVPSEAVLRAGEEAFLLLPPGEAEIFPRYIEVETGEEKDGRTEITEGLDEECALVLPSSCKEDCDWFLRRMGYNAAETPAE